MRDNPSKRSNAKSQNVARRRQAAHPDSARQNYEHYLALARAEDRNGDRVTAENYYQHAEHYLRSEIDSADLLQANP